MKLFIDNSRRKQPDLAKLLLLDDEPYDPVSLDDAETPSESSVDSQNLHPTASLASSSQLPTSSSIPASATTKPPATHPSASPAGDTCPTTEEEVDEVEQQKHDDSPVQSHLFPKEKPLSTARNLPSWMRDAPSPAPRPAKRAAPASQRKPAASPKPTASSSAPKRLKTATSPRGRAVPRSRRPNPAKRAGAQPSTSSESEFEEAEEEELVEENDEQTTHHLPPAASPSLPPSKRLSKVIDDDEEPEGDNDAAPEARSASVCEGLPSDFANLDKRTVVELRQLCRNFNIRAVRSNKTQLVELLAAFLKSQMRATPSPPPSKVAQPIVSPSSISSLSHTSLSQTSLSHPSLSHTSLSPLSLGANSPLPSGTGASESSRQLFHSSSSDEAIPTVVRKRTKVKPEHRPQQQQTSSAVISTMPHVSTAVQQSNKASSFNPDATLIEEVDVPAVLSGTLIVSDDGHTLRVSGETNTLRLSGDANTLRLSGDANTLRLSGTLVVSDDPHTLVVSDDAGTLAVPSIIPLPHGSATIPVPYGSATIPVPYASSLASDSVDSTLLLDSTLLDSSASLTLAHECQSADPTLRISGELPIDHHESKLPSFDVNTNNINNQLASPLIQRKKELYSSFLSPPFHVEQPTVIVISLSDGLIFPLFERKCIQICRKSSSSKSPISRCHFELFLLQGKPMCHDRSKNGTFVNHTRIPSHQIHPLNDGDLISISQSDSFLLKYLIS